MAAVHGKNAYGVGKPITGLRHSFAQIPDFAPARDHTRPHWRPQPPNPWRERAVDTVITERRVFAIQKTGAGARLIRVIGVFCQSQNGLLRARRSMPARHPGFRCGRHRVGRRVSGRARYGARAPSGWPRPREAASGESADRARYRPFMDAKTEELRAAHDVLAKFYADRLADALDRMAVLGLFSELTLAAGLGTTVGDVGCGTGRLVGGVPMAAAVVPERVRASSRTVRRRDRVPASGVPGRLRGRTIVRANAGVPKRSST